MSRSKRNPRRAIVMIALARQEPRRRTPTSALDTRPPLGTHASFISRTNLSTRSPTVFSNSMRLT